MKVSLFFFFLFLFLFLNTHLHFSSYRYGSSYVPSVLRSIPKSTPNTLRSSCLCCAYYSNHALTFTCWCSRTTNPVIEVRWVYKEFESENWKKRNTISLKFFFTCFSLLFYVYIIYKKCSCGRMEEKFIGRKGDVIIIFFFLFQIISCPNFSSNSFNKFFNRISRAFFHARIRFTVVIRRFNHV